MDTRNAVRVMMFISNKPNLTPKIPFFKAAIVIVTSFLTTGYDCIILRIAVNFDYQLILFTLVRLKIS
jgi:hypothetical protein